MSSCEQVWFDLKKYIKNIFFLLHSSIKIYITAQYKQYIKLDRIAVLDRSLGIFFFTSSECHIINNIFLE